MNRRQRDGLRGLALLGALGLIACSERHHDNADTAPAPSSLAADLSQEVVQRNPRVTTSQAFPSRPLRELPPAVGLDDEREVREPGRNPFSHFTPNVVDPVLQNKLPNVSMPVALNSFLGQGSTLGGCTFPKPDGGEPSHCTTRGDPPDTVGAVGPNHYVQLVNSGIAVWAKDGGILQQPTFTSALWTGYPMTDGNKCGNAPADGGDWGDGVVLYDQMADRWVVTQFDISNGVATNTGPSYQCVAVSQTGDPTGAYWLYDFQYNVAINDYGKFSVWEDGYYASFNDFDPGFVSANVCAYDRASMLQGKPATQQCFTNTAFGFLPANVDGAIKPPQGEPAFFVTLHSATSLGLYKFHVDWATPNNSSFTGPTVVTVGGYLELCLGGSCVVQPSPGNMLGSLGDRPMFHLAYRNFGAFESLVFNHSVIAGSVGGVRWYEIQAPNGTPTVAQQGTYAPGDGNFRWMGSIAEDQAQDMALGFAISGPSQLPSVGWTGRLASDPVNQMGQGESVVQAGVGVETGNFSNGTAAQRWGDYSNMVVDPADDCTLWYTQELFPANGIFNWDTRVASVKFPNCAANDFGQGLLPATKNLPESSTANYTVATTLGAGTAETVALFVQDLPTGVTGTFNPATVMAGASSTLTLTAAASAPLATATFTVIGKAPSAVHAATAQVVVVPPCVALTTCPGPDNCGTISDGCGGLLTCSPGCTTPQTCGGGGTANVCGCRPLTACPNGDNCGTVPDGCGGTVTCSPGCTAPQTCAGGGTANVCGCTPSHACPTGANCGTVSDGCGGTVTCGAACTAPKTCGGGGPANVCGCTPLTVCPTGVTCGTAPDGCGGTLVCGTCAATQTCTNNKCVNGAPRAGGCGCGATDSFAGAAAMLLGFGGLVLFNRRRRR